MYGKRVNGGGRRVMDKGAKGRGEKIVTGWEGGGRSGDGYRVR